jgi:hypothetical protein
MIVIKYEKYITQTIEITSNLDFKEPIKRWLAA